MCSNNNFEVFNKFEEEIRKVLKPERYWHSVSVALTAANIASIYDVDKDEAIISGLLHDYAKNMTIEEQLKMCDEYKLALSDEDKKALGCIHGFLSARLAKEKFNINDNIYNAIYYHTCGRPNMTILEKIIYLSDYIEPLRRFRDKNENVRKLVLEKKIDEAIPFACLMTIDYLKQHNEYIHTNTYKTLEYYSKK